MFNSLVFDIAQRNPISKIIFNGTDYFLMSENKRIPLFQEEIEELISKNFVTKNKHGGIIVTNLALKHSETLVTTKKIESKKQPGHFFDCHVVPEPFRRKDGNI